MKIGIIGATGKAGREIYKEALTRGHEVVGIVRSHAKAEEILGGEAKLIVKDAFELEKSELENFDVVVDAFGTDAKTAYLHTDLATKLVAMFREEESPRLFFILGAGSLLDQEENLLVESIKKLPGADAWVATPINQYKELEFLREVDNVNWVGVSPSASFIVGERKEPIIGEDHLLVSSDGDSHVTTGTMAVAILDEIENPSVVRGRFTVADK